MGVDARFATMLDTLYAGALDDERWLTALNGLADDFGGTLALFSTNPSTGEVHRADLVRNDPLLLREYGEVWMSQDPRHLVGLTRPVGEPQTESTLVRWREFIRTPVYNEFLRPADITLFMATWIERRADRGVVLSIQRDRATGAFDPEDRHRMALLVPHIRRIVEIKDRLASAGCLATSLLETMERAPFGVLLLSSTLRVLEASRLAREILAARDGLHADDGSLGFVARADAAAFARRLVEDPARAGASDYVHVRRPGGAEALRVMVIPLPRVPEGWLRPSAHWLVLVVDPARRPRLPVRALQADLGITLAEALLAQHLAHGERLADAAAALGITVNTARTQLKSIYAKCGLSSQAQLARRILSGPAGLGIL